MPVKKLDVSIEINGRQREVGVISGSNDYDASFCYSEHYLDSGTARPISISLPLTEEPYGPEATRRFFEGLLPEGFMRRTVAEQNRTDDGDYLSILEMLGAECLGAVQIKGENYKYTEPSYRLFDPEAMYKLAAEGATRSADLVVEAHLSLTGASGKVGAYKNTEGQWFLPVGSAPSTHILKQSHIRYDKIVQNEQLALRTAEFLGIDVPKSEIVEAYPEQVHESMLRAPLTENVLFATERYDRTFEGAESLIDGMLCPLRLHQEDFGQAMGIPASGKYERPGEKHMKKMFDLLRRCSASPIEDQMKLWDVIVFHWLIGNTDGHIKNFALVYDANLKAVRLAPAYDIVSTILYDTHSSEMAFSVGGQIEWKKIDCSCFEEACKECGLNKKLFMQRFDEKRAVFRDALRRAAETVRDEGFEDALWMAERILEVRDAAAE